MPARHELPVGGQDRFNTCATPDWFFLLLADLLITRKTLLFKHIKSIPNQTHHLLSISTTQHTPKYITKNTATTRTRTEYLRRNNSTSATTGALPFS